MSVRKHDLTVDFNTVSVIIDFEKEPEDVNQWLKDNHSENPYEFVAKVCKYPVSQIGVILKNV